MARGTQLQALVTQFKAEVRATPSVAAGVADLDRIKWLLKKHQDLLYEEYIWPFFKVKPYVPLLAGQRYYDAPTNLNYDRISDVVVWYNGHPQPIERGIGFDELAAYDSDSDVRAEPVLKWDLTADDGATQVEVWPIPLTSDGKLQFLGVRPLSPLIADTDPADLDDILIVLNAAAEELTSQGDKGAQLKLAMAQGRFNRLKGNSQGGGGIVHIGGTGHKQKSREHITILVK